ncbi:hypothetical protein E2C01_074636 [Portunus trituberculatus]|uniref:Uncharacterized protein n=1 Tax=Portunus trituberculatus TaxID=210409 RepID=A0A5B7I3T2_PORTR|nr:hypothetical protein [Portunus trituberculatus]
MMYVRSFYTGWCPASPLPHLASLFGLLRPHASWDTPSRRRQVSRSFTL